MNESVVENGSNLTGRDAATPEGIAITYGSLFVMALIPLFFGSLRSVRYHTSLKVGFSQTSPSLFGLLCSQIRGEEAGDRIGMRDAAMFPVYASGGLFGLYLFFKVSELLLAMPVAMLVCLSLAYSVSAQGVCEYDSECPFPCSGDQCSHQSHQVRPCHVTPSLPLPLSSVTSCIVNPLIPASWTQKLTHYTLKLTVRAPGKEPGGPLFIS